MPPCKVTDENWLSHCKEKSSLQKKVIVTIWRDFYKNEKLTDVTHGLNTGCGQSIEPPIIQNMAYFWSFYAKGMKKSHIGWV